MRRLTRAAVSTPRHGDTGVGAATAPHVGVAADTRTLIRTDGLTKTFDSGRVTAVDRFDLEVVEGQLLVLLGLSGSGKSTLLRLLNGLAEPTAGQVEVLGQQPNKLRPKQLRTLRRDIGFVFQQHNVVGRLTALENVLNGGLADLRCPRYGVTTYPKSMRRRAYEQLERVGLEDRAFQRCSTLSGGEQQRVGIARALYQAPKIILADEPVASLDPSTAKRVMELLSRCSREDQITTVCSLHQMDLASTWGDRIVGLRDGRKVFDAAAGSFDPKDLAEIYTGTDPDAYEPD